MTFQHVLDESVVRLAEAGVPDPRVDAELLAGFVLGVSRGGVQAKAATSTRIDEADAAALAALVARRAAREPLQHITGRAPFRSIELAVGPGVFVPRPETEVVAGIAVDALAAATFPGRALPGPAGTALEGPIAVDLGTGSGAIALALASEVPHARVFGVEVSPEAFAWAEQNFAGFDNATAFLGDLVDALHELDGTVAVVASNPPYIPADAVPRDPEVRLFDPELALYGGPDGLDVVRQVSATALRLLHPGGTVVIEHGESQAADIAALLRADGWSAISSHRDLTGRDRATTALR